MNPLQEYPHLFANGKFKIKTYTGHEYDLGNGVTLAALKNGVGRFTDVKLIARKIEDMTEEEIKFVYGFDIITNKERLIKDLKIKAEMGTIPSNQFLRIKSIGVYPFDQSHFKDGTVININEI